MSDSSSKKRKLFVDLSEDLFAENKNFNKKIISKEEPKPKNEFLENKQIKENKEPRFQEKNFEEENNSKVTVSDTLNIIGEEPLDKGFHFYSSERVMNKVKRFAKEKNIKLSRLITIILDKTIKEK